MFRGFKALFSSTTHADAFEEDNGQRMPFRSTTDLFDDDLPKPDLKNESPAATPQNNTAQNNVKQQPQKKKSPGMFSSGGEESLAEALNSIAASRSNDIPDEFAMGSSQPNNPNEKDELPELLDDDDTLHRAKELSDFGLIQYLSRDDILSRLIKIVTQDFDESELKEESVDVRTALLEKFRFKFPYMASELLISTVGKTYLLPKIIEDSPLSKKKSSANKVFLLDELFSLSAQDTIPPHLARHYIKLLMHMGRISSLSSKLMGYIYSNNGKVFKQFIKHTNLTEDVCEWILMCLLYEREEEDDSSSDDGDDDDDDDNDNSNNKNAHHRSSNNHNSSSNPPGDLVVKGEVISLLASFINKEDYSENVAAVLSTIVSLARPSQVVDHLLKQEQIDAIVTSILGVTQIPDVFSEGMDFLGTMVINSQQGDPSMIVLMNNLVKFVDLLKTPIGLQAVSIPSGTVNPPLGVYRLKIIEFFVILFKHFEELTQVHSDLNIKEPIIKCGILPIVIELFFNYPNNNILHNLVTHIVQCIIENKYEDFMAILFDECKLVEKIIEAFNHNKQAVKKTRTSLGYMGHITIMENFLSTLELDNYKARIQSTAGWNRFAEESKEKHFIECVYRHGGQTPLPKSYVQRREAEDAELKAEEEKAKQKDENKEAAPPQEAQQQEQTKAEVQAKEENSEEIIVVEASEQEQEKVLAAEEQAK